VFVVPNVEVERYLLLSAEDLNEELDATLFVKVLKDLDFLGVSRVPDEVPE
jgi:hypothetical protein